MLARNETTGKVSPKKVVRTTRKHADVTVSITFGDAKSGQVVETITASREHPFYVEGKGFVVAGGLAIGNSIVTRAGPALVVKSVTWNRRPEGYAVFNFVVEDDHTYFVGNVNGGAWVHNPIQYELPFGDLPYSPPPANEGAAAAGLHENLPAFGQTKSTTAVLVAEDEAGTLQTIVGHSEDAVPAAIRKAMPQGWIPARGAGHAEVTALNEARKRGYTPLRIGASRPICPGCAGEITSSGAVPVSPLK